MSNDERPAQPGGHGCLIVVVIAVIGLIIWGAIAGVSEQRRKDCEANVDITYRLLVDELHDQGYLGRSAGNEAYRRLKPEYDACDK